MLASVRSLRRIILWIALACGVTAALVPPVGYFYLNFAHEVEELEFETRGAAQRIAAYATRQDGLNPSQEENLRRLITLPELEARGYARRVLDREQRVLAARGKAEGLLVIRETDAIVVGGQPVGSVTFALSLDGYLLNTIWFAVASTLFGCLVFAVVHYIPVRALDRALAALREQMAATTGTYEALKARDLRLQETNVELEQARTKAEASSRSKSEFLANMSHELRTPLNAIIGFSEMIGAQFAGPIPKKYLDYASDIQKSGAHLLAIVNNVLDISRIEAGKVKLDLHPVPVPDVVDDCCRVLREEALGAGVRLDADASGVAVLADRTKLKQALINILANAIKFTGKGGTVRVRAQDVADAVEFTISDTGIGMSAGDIAIALERFRQVDGSHTRKYGGAGLGLPIAKSLVELQGGAFSISSAPGAGTTVVIRMPRARSGTTVLAA